MRPIGFIVVICDRTLFASLIDTTMTNLIVSSSVIINAPAAKVWEVLTTPSTIKLYMFGADVRSDWKVGSPITYSGSWEGKAYEDKGTILKIEPGKVLQTSYWSEVFNLPDLPENYKQVTYTLVENNGQTELTITQDNNTSEKERDRSQKNWDLVLQGIKGVAEQPASSGA